MLYPLHNQETFVYVCVLHPYVVERTPIVCKPYSIRYRVSNFVQITGAVGVVSVESQGSCPYI